MAYYAMPHPTHCHLVLKLNNALSRSCIHIFSDLDMETELNEQLIRYGSATGSLVSCTCHLEIYVFITKLETCTQQQWQAYAKYADNILEIVIYKVWIHKIETYSQYKDLPCHRSLLQIYLALVFLSLQDIIWVFQLLAGHADISHARQQQTVQLFEGGTFDASYNDRESIHVKTPKHLTHAILTATVTGQAMY